MQIIAATDFSTRSTRALRQAGLLAQGDSQLHIVHVVDDDLPRAMVVAERREAERVLQEQIDGIRELRNIVAHSMVVEGDPFDGIVRAAESVNADLIVMGAHRKQLLLDMFVGTTIERVIRKTEVPVLMVNNEAQQSYKSVLVPIEISDPSVNALRVALSLGLASHGNAMLLHAFSALAKGKMYSSDSVSATSGHYAAEGQQHAEGEIVAFLGSHNLNTGRWAIRAHEGGPMEVISRTVSEMRPDLLVMGTHSRTGLIKTFLGSVTEEVLRSLNVDILVVPPPKQVS